MPAVTITTDTGVEAFLDAHHDERLESYFELLRIPSISTLAEHAPDMVRAAEWIAAELRRIGLEHAESSTTPGHPIVYARLAPRRGRADDPRLLPLRRAARRPDRPVGDGAVRPVRAATAAWSGAARRTTRASCTCT